MRICEVKGCNKKHYGLGYCSKHYMQKRLHGKILEKTVFDKNDIIVKKDIALVVLRDKKLKEKGTAIIDKKNIRKVNNFKWCLSGNGYVMSNTNKKAIYLHHCIIGKKHRLEVDHINRNKLDNRINNLRFVDRTINNLNKNSKGISWNKEKKKWCAHIGYKYKQYFLGYFINKKDAMFVKKNIMDYLISRFDQISEDYIDLINK